MSLAFVEIPLKSVRNCVWVSAMTSFRAIRKEQVFEQVLATVRCGRARSWGLIWTLLTRSCELCRSNSSRGQGRSGLIRREFALLSSTHLDRVSRLWWRHVTDEVRASERSVRTRSCYNIVVWWENIRKIFCSINSREYLKHDASLELRDTA